MMSLESRLLVQCWPVGPAVLTSRGFLLYNQGNEGKYDD